jgi:hypothetical protein
MQLAVADIENAVFARPLKAIAINKPVFVTSLPRAGTTLLLELLSKLPVFAAQTYTDMPFVLCPLFWRRIVNRSSASITSRERAHGDGMVIGIDSAESFEEVLWNAFWPTNDDKPIKIWNEAQSDNFSAAFEAYMRKVILLRPNPDNIARRYLSKNNVNIARIAFIKKLFPDCMIVVPFRSPEQHVASLFTQHHNFLKMHKTDAFTKQYMRYLGHLEFGELLKPIDFDSWTRHSVLQPDQREFWLEYWLATFGFLLKHHVKDVVFFDYDKLVNDPKKSLQILAHRIEVDAIPLVELGVQQLRSPTTTKQSAAVNERSLEVHKELQAIAINKR